MSFFRVVFVVWLVCDSFTTFVVVVVVFIVVVIMSITCCCPGSVYLILTSLTLWLVCTEIRWYVTNCLFRFSLGGSHANPLCFSWAARKLLHTALHSTALRTRCRCDEFVPTSIANVLRFHFSTTTTTTIITNCGQNINFKFYKGLRFAVLNVGRGEMRRMVAVVVLCAMCMEQLIFVLSVCITLQCLLNSKSAADNDETWIEKLWHPNTSKIIP